MNANMEFVAKALVQLEDELPQLVDAAVRANIAIQYHKKIEHLRSLEKEQEIARCCAETIDLISPYPVVKERLNLLLESSDLVHNFFVGMSTLAEQLGLPEITVQRLRSEAFQKQNLTDLRTVTFKHNVVDDMKSIKIQNIDFDFGEFGSLSAGIVLTAKGMIDDANPLWLAAGVVLIASLLYKASTKDIPQQEATVLWGLIRACDKNKQSTQAMILQHTNRERKKIGLEPLSKQQLGLSLNKLASYKVVKPVKNLTETWQIIEKVIIK